MSDLKDGECCHEGRRHAQETGEKPSSHPGPCTFDRLREAVSAAAEKVGVRPPASARGVSNACNACGKQMERGAVMVCHECAGKSVIHPTALKVGETIRWSKDSDFPHLEKTGAECPCPCHDKRQFRHMEACCKQTYVPRAELKP